MALKVICAAILVIALLFISENNCSEAYEDLFHISDTNNDTFLSHDECHNLWWIFDGDKNKIITKLEFEVRWTFLGLAHHEHAPLFFEQLDRNFNKEADLKEVKRICSYFDDDVDGFVSKFEYDLNWIGLFNIQ